jgi:carbamoyltransferase
VLREDVAEYFETRPNEDSPYMLLVADVQAAKRADCDAQLREARGLAKLPIVRSVVPAITHVDYSARIQTVDEVRHGLYYRLIRRFKEKTGCPVIINTSFNVRSEPIVCSPEHAYRCFMATNMDVLVMGHYVLLRERQPQAEQHKVDEYLAQFQLD